MRILNQTRNHCHQEIEIHRRTNRFCPASGRSRYSCRRDLSAAGSLTGNLFQLEEKIWRHGCSRTAPSSPTRRGKRPVKKLVADLSLDKPMLQDVIKKSCKAMKETRTGELSPQCLSGFHPSSLPDSAVTAFNLVLQVTSTG